ncbi:hypothetical protein ACNPM1_16580 [Enterobacter pseudoroggenkampii]|uniref:hypothetical protein n=1 Tax=Enterobacter pseudoroggenkampii TaxID=2996112 RepID=UPI003AB0650A
MKAVFWGFVGSLVIMVTTLVWGYYSSTKELTVSKVSHDIVISPSTEIDGISIFYNDNIINNLSKTVFVVENTGRVAIKSSDIVSPLVINIIGQAKVFDFILNGMSPSNIDAVLTRYKNKNAASVEFSLLNPGDKFNISVLSDSSESPDVFAQARIDGIKSIIINNKINENGTVYSVFLWVCIILSSMSMLLSFVFFKDYKNECKFKSLIKSNEFMFPDNNVNIPTWVNNNFDFYQESERAKITDILNNSSEKTNEEKLKLVEHVSKGFVSNLGPALTVFVLGATGAWFSLNALGFI